MTFTLTESAPASPASGPFATPAIVRTTDHRYYYQGIEYPGVTGILKVLDKSGPLMAWAARNTAEAALALWETPDTLRTLMNTVGPEGVVKALTSRSAWKRDEAAALGTEVHAIADLIVSGKSTPVMSPSALERVMRYKDWWLASGWTLRLSEALVVNTQLGYGGTFDLLARDRDGRTVLADIKTGKAVYHEAVLQLAAYGMAELVAPMGSEKAYPMPPIDRYVVLHVTLEGVREVEVPIGELEREAFTSCHLLAGWQRTLKGRSL